MLKAENHCAISAGDQVNGGFLRSKSNERSIVMQGDANMKRWTTTDMPDQTGRIAIVTGANSGLGYETTLALAQKGAQVVMTTRSLDKGRSAEADVRQHMPDAKLDAMKLDLGSLDSVREFAAEYKAKFNRLDMLINNAGVMGTPKLATADGFEMQLGVNHLGHFALTGHLIDLLVSTPGSRIVSVSSNASYMGTINFDDLMSEQSYTRYGAYSQSKLANVMFGFELQRKLQAVNADSRSIAVHPGYAATNLQGGAAHSSGALADRFIYPITNRIVAQSGAMGALSQLYAATAPDAKGGAFYGPHFLHMRGYPVELKANDAAYDTVATARLWDVSVQLTGVEYALLAAARV
jgi:hypothetical protein